VILITGGTGYLGSHACIKFEEAGYKTLLLDNLSNSNKTIVKTINNILGHEVGFIEGDINDKLIIEALFRENSIDAVLHFAGLKSVSDSIISPHDYYVTNLVGSIRLLETMKQYNCRKLIFSSSATVYGHPAKLPITEDMPTNPLNPYGNSKLFVETYLQDLIKSDESWKIAILRYFNPVGAHESGVMGESPKNEPQNLFPIISEVAFGLRDKLLIYGSDYETKDGTGVRDYIHINDLVSGHLDAYNYLESFDGIEILNLGTGKGITVLEIVKKFEEITGQRISYELTSRRPGDVASCYNDPSKASKILNWNTKLGLQEMCIDQWKWQQYLGSK